MKTIIPATNELRTLGDPGAPQSPEETGNSTCDKASYALRRDQGFWHLTFGGRGAILRHERGLAYVAFLIMDPTEEPIHGLALTFKVQAMEKGLAGGAGLVQERNLALDDAEAARRLFLKQRELERVVDDEGEAEPVRQEALRDLEAIYSFQRKNLSRTRNVAQQASDSVGKAMKRFYDRLAKAVYSDGRPHLVLRAFAMHIKLTILIPSGRCAGHGGCRPAGGCGGFFKYERTEGVIGSRGSD